MTGGHDMTDNQDPPAEEPRPDEAQPETPTDGGSEADKGKAFAILSYALSFVGIPFFIVPLIMRDNAFSLFHSKQVLLLWIAGIVVGTISAPLVAMCIGLVLLPVFGLALLLLFILGLINACNGAEKPVPLIGHYAVDWFKGITKA